MANNAGKILKKSGTWLLRIIGGLLVFILLGIGILQTQWGKDMSRDIAVNYLRKKLQIKISIDEFKVEWLSHLSLKGVYIEDRQKRKLLTVQELDVKYDLAAIFKNQLTINDFTIQGHAVRMVRIPDDAGTVVGHINSYRVDHTISIPRSKT